MSGPLNSNISGASSNLRDSTGKSFTSSFSGQSGSLPGFHHSGAHNIHGNLNLSNMSGSLAPRNASMTGLLSPGVQQPGGNISSGRFPSNNLQASVSQIPHGHSGISNRGGMNVAGSPVFSGSMNAIGGSIQGLSSNLANVGNRNSAPGLAASPVLGNLGPRITNSGNIVGGSSIGRSISSAGLSMPGIVSRLNLSGNSGNEAINIQGSNRMSSMLQQASPQFMNMLGNSYPTPGGSLSHNQVQAGNSSLGSSGMLHDGSSCDTSPFDISDFPELTGRPNSAGGGQGQYGSLRKHGVSVNSIVQQNQEFSIQNEDFPALPGYKGSSSDYAMDMHHKDHLHENVNIMQAQHYPMSRSSGFNLGGSYLPRQQHPQSANSVQNTRLENIGLRPANSPSPSNSGVYEQLRQQYHQPQTQNSLRLQASSGPQQYKDQSLKSVQGTQTVPDPYSLLGLLSLIRLKEPGPTSLALGIDLTTLGLNLNSQDNLYKTFGSPWSNEPAKGEPDYQIPACFSARPPPALQPLHFQKFHPLTLFYIFYSMPKDVAQLYAANELYNKGWFYHKEYRVWLTRVPNVAPLVKNPLHERGAYICFDPNIWDTIHKDNFVLHYEAVEKRPVLPSAAQNVRREI
ncbi:probable NOT transcription complex subunit VIP2 isoform X2 [Phragmites australis]|uniref:probable NOT transcription complex subunit VIP2 isoform X2 n=1 Tax=Phragmites australis TaxID=29695 RepID=UPI002D783631|nr:probable NOT transcription complex subunit VIP2 isoform X2 [Phragmites australis]